MFHTRLFAVALLLILTFNSIYAAYRAPACSRDGMAATPHPLATEAAVAVLKAGGNAVDAAVAAAFVLAVTTPYHSGIGGGEFAIVRTVEGLITTLDARECAPAKLTASLFIDPKSSEPIKGKSETGGLAAGVPGSVLGRVELVRRFGKLPLKSDVAGAIRLAEGGFAVDWYLANQLKSNVKEMREANATPFLKDDTLCLSRGDWILQPALARTLTTIANDNGESFYHGEMAVGIARSDVETGGVMTSSDLAGYRVIEREPIHFSYRDFDIYSMAPPSSGGLCLAEILQTLEPISLKDLQYGSPKSIHLEASAFERAFADRAQFIGDPAFTPIPLGMASKKYAQQQCNTIDLNKRTTVSTPTSFPNSKSSHTSHLSVIDKDGMMCSITTSVNGGFGSFVWISEYGFFLNNTMDDFTISTKTENQFKLKQGEVNRVEPGKRPLSSMSPTLVLKGGKPYLALGSVGGPRIITSVAQMLVNIIDYRMDVQGAIDAPRIHMQWQPDALYMEQEMSPLVRASLEGIGWKVEAGGHWSLSQAVMLDEDGLFYGGADSRGIGSAAGPLPLP